MFDRFFNRFDTRSSRGFHAVANEAARESFRSAASAARAENMSSLLSMDTVLAVSIFAALRLIISLIGLIIRVIGVIIGNLISLRPDLAPAS